MALPTIDLNSVGGVKNLADLYNLISGTEQTTSGSTTTTTEGVSQDGMNEMLKSALANTNGLAAVSSGQRMAGGYGSSVNTMLTNDLLTRTASQIAQQNKTSTVTRSPTTVTTGGITASGAAKSASFVAALQGLTELDKLTGASKKIKDLYSSATTEDPGISGIQISGDNATGNPNFYSSSPAATSGDSFSGIDYTSDFDVSGFTQSPDFTTVDMSPVDTGGVDLSGITDDIASEYNLLFETGFADGGQVSAKQNRQSILGASQFNRVVDPRAGKIGGGSGVNLPNVDGVTDVITPSQNSDSGSSNGSKGADATGDSVGKFVNALATEDGQKFAKVLGTLGKLTQSPALQQAGLLSGVATAENPGQAAVLTAGNIATRGVLGKALQAGKVLKDPSMENIVDTAMTVNPITAGINGVLGMLGFRTIGETAGDVKNNIDLTSDTRNHMSPEQQQAARDWAAQQGQQVSENVVTQPVGVDVGSIVAGEAGMPTVSAGGGSGGYSTAYGWGTASNPNFSDRGPGGSSGDSEAAAAGATAAGPGYSYGGDVEGPGTGTSDSIKTTLSDGETVVTARTTAKVKEMFGDDFFHKLEQQFNAPAAVKQKLMGRA